MTTNQSADRPGRKEPYRIGLPGFVPDEPIGLGDAIKRATSVVGIKPCGPCAARAERLNNWAVLGGKKR